MKRAASCQRVGADDKPAISVVIPCFNERENLRPLLEELGAVMDSIGSPWEIIVTDDCSTDGSWEELLSIASQSSSIRIQRLRRNCGETAASWAGMRAARGDVIVTIDSDLQNSPKEIPLLLAALPRYDLVCGTRSRSRSAGDGLTRIFYSKITNRVRAAILGDRISDSGCTFRAFRRECLEGLQPFRGLHRFLPSVFKIQGYTVLEIPVSHRPRIHGKSKYGVCDRLFSSFADLMAVRWMKSRSIRIELQDPEPPGPDR